MEQTSRKEYAVRFLFGGIVTAVVAVLGKRFGPVVAGLFFAFPAILPASLTLIAEHEGKRAAGDDARGAAAGSIGLIAFGAAVWVGAPRIPAWSVLAAASTAWLVVSLLVWLALD